MWELTEINHARHHFIVKHLNTNRFLDFYVFNIHEIELNGNLAIVTTKTFKRLEIDLDSGKRKLLGDC